MTRRRCSCPHLHLGVGPGHRQPDFAQIFGGKPQIVRSTFRRPVTEDIPNRLQRSTMAQQLNGIRMAETVGALKGNIQSTVA